MEKVLLQISSGRGPRECAYAVARILAILQKEAKAWGLASSLVEHEKAQGAPPEAWLSATVELTGPNVHAFANQWQGTLQWIGTSPYRPTHKRKNWFVGVMRVEALVLPSQLEGQVVTRSMRASGPGGQNVNKTNSAVRAIHVDSGIMVTSRESRSQAQNQSLARKKLQDIFDQQQEQLSKAREEKKWAEHQKVERGNPTRVFHGPDFIER